MPCEWWKMGKFAPLRERANRAAAATADLRLKATLNGPKNLWIDKMDDVLIADAENNLIRKYVAKDGTIVRVAGTGKKGASKLGAPWKPSYLGRMALRWGRTGRCISSIARIAGC